ncbi:MAG TPA: hypothetical protein DC049_14565 [Spirochaetia bacterium]|nr:hypothetical protein [Spirochaetia bacterium]
MDIKKVCVIIPVYNNGATVKTVIQSVRKYIPVIYAVNDGSTDNTAQALQESGYLKTITFTRNCGKGSALIAGFTEAYKDGFEAAITIDADGQHFADDIPVFLENLQNNTLITGVRIFEKGKNSVSANGREISNFFCTVYTHTRFYDAQSGFRLYPLEPISRMRFSASRYDFEIEVLIRSAWEGVKIRHVPVKVHYDPPGKRISHFHLLYDNLRLIRLNSGLFFEMFIKLPRMYLRKIF